MMLNRIVLAGLLSALLGAAVLGATAVGAAPWETAEVRPQNRTYLAIAPRGTDAMQRGIDPAATDGRLFGTLLSDPRSAAAEHAVGVRVVHLELGWDLYEPDDGVFSEAYAAEAKEKLRVFRSAGMKVVVGVGLQYPPRWAYAYPNSRYVDQFGAAAGPLNLTFNQPLREKAERYIARVVRDLGAENIWAVRVGAGGEVELLYPAHDAGGSLNSYWGFDAAAQGGPGRPPSVPPSPFPGWSPGQRTYAGQSFTAEQARQWYEWYLGALVDGAEWQIGAYRRAGFSGYVHLLMPGQGSRPREYRRAIEHHLDGTGDRNRTMPRGAVWHRVLELLDDRANVVAYVSSMADGSGGDDVCQPGDAQVSPDDPAAYLWSAARWISYNADRFGMAKLGENPGRRDTDRYGPAMMEAAAAQARACGHQGLMWAHASELHDPGAPVSLDDYARVIARFGR